MIDVSISKLCTYKTQFEMEYRKCTFMLYELKEIEIRLKRVIKIDEESFGLKKLILMYEITLKRLRVYIDSLEKIIEIYTNSERHIVTGANSHGRKKLPFSHEWVDLSVLNFHLSDVIVM